MGAFRRILAVSIFLSFVLFKLLQTKTSNPFGDLFPKWRLREVDFEDGKESKASSSEEDDLSKQRKDLRDGRPSGDELDEMSSNEHDDSYGGGEEDVEKTRRRREPPSAIPDDPQLAAIQDLAKRSNGTSNDVSRWDDSRIPNYYSDVYDVYRCDSLYAEEGSHPRFMVIGVHKGGSTALYDYLSKHGRVRPATCKEIHFFDDAYRWHKGKSWYLRHFPDVSMWKDRIVTGEGSPNYIREPTVPLRIKQMFPATKFLLTLREPVIRFQSHWVGRKDNKKGAFVSMTCEEAWNSSVVLFDKCLSKMSRKSCERRLHENAAVRGIYVTQIERWLEVFPSRQFHIIQAEAMFNEPDTILQRVADFLRIRPYTQQELESLQNAKKGSAHHEEPLLEECKHLRERMADFYKEPNQRLLELLKTHFPNVLENWVDTWSGI